MLADSVFKLEVSVFMELVSHLVDLLLAKEPREVYRKPARLAFEGLISYHLLCHS